MEKAISSDLIRGHIDTIILHTLLDGDKYAQQISETIESKSGNQYVINQATLYSSLKRLENQKYVNAYWYDAVGGRRRYFKLTELGRRTVEENLSDWSFSRAIIDKLIDFEAPATQPASQPVIIEKIVTVKPSCTDKASPAELKKSDSDALTQKNERVIAPEAKEENVQEINFRNILNGLIKNNNIQKEYEETKAPDVDIRSENVQNSAKERFNETILEESHAANFNTGVADFGDLSQKAVKEGYKIRISTKGTKIPTGSVYVNKINVCSSMIVFFLVALEYLCFSIGFNQILNLSLPAVIISIALLALYPIISAIIFFKNPFKTSKQIKPDTILTAAIVVFNLLLVTFAGNLLFDVRFTDTYSILLSLVFPVVLFFDALIYFVFRVLLSGRENFKVKVAK